ncbi:MAG TPA: hypothetical protein VGB37_12645 [Candidatus Lokiarchaeia archaeon]
MPPFKNNWLFYLLFTGEIMIFIALFITKADKSYVDNQVEIILKTVGTPLKDISFKLDTIINQSKNEREGN